MSNRFKSSAYGIIQKRHTTTTSERGDDSCDELLIDIEEPAEVVSKPNSQKMMRGNLPEVKYSEAYYQHSEDLLPRNSHDAQVINDCSELGYVDEISDKFSKMNTSSTISGSYVRNPSTCHSVQFEVLEQNNKKTNIKYKKHEQFQASPCFKTHGLFHVSETPGDFCTKFKTLLGSNEKLITLDNVRDIKLKSRGFSELTCHEFIESKQHMQVSKRKDIINKNYVKCDTRISSKNVTVGEMSEKYRGANSASNSSFKFTKNTLNEKDKAKIRAEKLNLRSKEKCNFNFAKDFKAKTSNEARHENAPKRHKLKNKRYSLPLMQGPLNDLDTMQFDQRKSIPFAFPIPNKLPNYGNRECTKQSRKRRASSSIKNIPEFVEPTSTSSVERRTDNQPGEPSSKLRKRCLSSTDAETS